MISTRVVFYLLSGRGLRSVGSQCRCLVLYVYGDRHGESALKGEDKKWGGHDGGGMTKGTEGRAKIWRKTEEIKIKKKKERITKAERGLGE